MKVLHFLDERLEETIVAALIGGMSILIAVQVFMRYVMFESLTWSEELARYMFIWLVYIGISYGVKRQRHISIDALATLLSPAWQRRVSILADFIFLAFAVLVTVKCVEVAQRIQKLGQTSPAMECPMWIIYTAAPIGFGLVCFRLVQNIVGKLKSAPESPDACGPDTAGTL